MSLNSLTPKHHLESIIETESNMISVDKPCADTGSARALMMRRADLLEQITASEQSEREEERVDGGSPSLFPPIEM